MQDTLYPLSSKDVEAIGKSRVNQETPQNMKVLMYAGLIVCLAGIYMAYVVNAMWGIILMVVGCAVIWTYSHFMDKRRNKMVKQLKREWRELEQGRAKVGSA